MTGRIGHHCEGPVWWARKNALRFVDMLADTVITLGESGPERTEVGGCGVAVIRPCRGSGAIIAREHDVVVCDEDLREPRCIGLIDSRPGMRCNEGGCSPDGDFFIGTMAEDQTTAAAGLYRVRAGGSSIERVLDRLTVSNGLDWSPDGSRAYHVDTPTRTVTEFAVDSAGGLDDRRLFARFGAADGLPDGLTVAADGSVWVAGNGGGAVFGFAPTGQLIERIDVDAGQVTACAFGGDSLEQLFITTSRENLSEDEDPAAGSVFVARPGVAGRPPLEFAGGGK